MDVRKLRNIVELLDEFDVAELKLKDKDSAVHIVRKRALSQYSLPPAVQTHQSSLQPQTQYTDDNLDQPQLSFSNKNQANTDTSKQQYSDEKVIKAPMVGTYYAAVSPESENFVSVGAKIKVGDAICIIEAMKIMNRIESDKTGVIKEILVENGHPVQYGQPLVVLE